ncbi:MAG: DUF7064 domain-containing protein [Candidatus Heimdallarchaeaceae archaeon]
MTRALKTWIMKKLIARQNRKNPFNSQYAETYQLPDDAPEHWNNSYYFTGHEEDGSAFLIRLAFRGTGQVETWFSLLLPQKGIYNYEKHIDVPAADGSLSSGPISFELIEIGKKWKVSFNGKARELNTGEPAAIQFEGHFISDLPLYDFSTDANPLSLAKALANEKWSKKFFEEIRKNKQTHYEQAGIFKGFVKIDDAKIDLDMKALRDHSFGPRDWDYMQRHVWLIGALDDGSYFNYSLVRYPSVKNITAGFVIKKEKVFSIVDGIKLDELYDGRTIPQDFNFWFVLEDGRRFQVKCSFEHSFSWNLNDVYQITEGIASFELNDVKAKGIAEFGNNISRRQKHG